MSDFYEQMSTQAIVPLPAGTWWEESDGKPGYPPERVPVFALLIMGAAGPTYAIDRAGMPRRLIQNAPGPAPGLGYLSHVAHVK